MKNFILAFAAIASFTVVSCRQSNDDISYEDASTLKIIENNRISKEHSSNDAAKNNDSINTSNQYDGEIQIPPRR